MTISFGTSISISPSHDTGRILFVDSDLVASKRLALPLRKYGKLSFAHTHENLQLRLHQQSFHLILINTRSDTSREHLISLLRTLVEFAPGTALALAGGCDADSSVHIPGLFRVASNANSIRRAAIIASEPRLSSIPALATIAIDTAERGELTITQTWVFVRLLLNSSPAELAHSLGVRDATAKWHRHNVLQNLGFRKTSFLQRDLFAMVLGLRIQTLCRDDC